MSADFAVFTSMIICYIPDILSYYMISYDIVIYSLLVYGRKFRKNVIDYLLSSNRAEVVKKNGRDTNFIKIGEKQYRYDKTKPISDRLETKLNKVKKKL